MREKQMEAEVRGEERDSEGNEENLNLGKKERNRREMMEVCSKRN